MIIPPWDIAVDGVIVSQLTDEERLQQGITPLDMAKMNAMVKSHVDHIEGRR